MPPPPSSFPRSSFPLPLLAVPWAFCFIMYSGLHLTYPRDRRRAAERQRSEEAREQEWEFEPEGGLPRFAVQLLCGAVAAGPIAARPAL